MLKKRWIIPLVITALLIALISIVVQFFNEDNKPKIVVVVQRLDIEYWKTFESGAKEAFSDFDIDGQVLAPESIYPISNQPNLLKKVLNQQPDALIVAPTDPSLALPVLEEYEKKNIPVLLASRDVEWKYKTAYIGTDHYTLGEMAGKLLGSMLQPGDQVAIIFGSQDDQAMIDRKNSIKKVLEGIGIEVVTEQSGYDHMGNPKPVIGTILEKYPNIKGVATTSDRLALDALKTIEEKELEIPVMDLLFEGTLDLIPRN
jgi:ribose transport system substrate-binding protein